MCTQNVTTTPLSFGFQGYKEAQAILISKVGELHPYVNRNYQNIGVYCEENGDYENAFDAYYKRYTSVELFGVKTTP